MVEVERTGVFQSHPRRALALTARFVRHHGSCVVRYGVHRRSHVCLTDCVSVIVFLDAQLGAYPGRSGLVQVRSDDRYGLDISTRALNKGISHVVNENAIANTGVFGTPRYFDISLSVLSVGGPQCNLDISISSSATSAPIACSRLICNPSHLLILGMVNFL